MKNVVKKKQLKKKLEKNHIWSCKEVYLEVMGI